MPKAENTPEQAARPMLLTARGVAFETGTSEATIWRWNAKDPSFPAPVKLSAGCTRWRRADVEAWIAARELATAEGAQ